MGCATGRSDTGGSGDTSGVEPGVGSDGQSHLCTESLVPRPLTEAEREVAWRAANFYDATANNESPIALWILGPSSVGKSTLTAAVGTEFDIPLSQSQNKNKNEQKAETARDLEDVRRQLDAVIVDGEFMRDEHGVWKRWVKTDDWRAAYPALKDVINKEKDNMEDMAVAARKHLVIPQTMLNLSKGLGDVERLLAMGYTNHILAVVAPLDECQRRGQAREVSTGKRYQPREYDRSIQAIPPMIGACNGRYQLIRAVEEGEKRMGYRVLAYGACGNSVANKLNQPVSSFDEGHLSRLIKDHVCVEIS